MSSHSYLEMKWDLQTRFLKKQLVFKVRCDFIEHSFQIPRSFVGDIGALCGCVYLFIFQIRGCVIHEKQIERLAQSDPWHR